MIKTIDSITEEFRRRFPADEGWKVNVNWPRASSGALTDKLNAFLRETGSKWLVTPPAGEGGLIAFSFTDDDGVLLPPEKSKWEMHRNGWSGEMTLCIEGEPLIIRNYYVPVMENRQGLFTLQAFKNEQVIPTLYRAILLWEAAKSNPKDKISVCEPNGIFSEPRPRLTWDDIILPGGLAADIRANVEGFFKCGALYKEIGVPHKRGFLLTGSPGNGKTLLAKILASDDSYHFCWLKLTNCTDDSSVSVAFKDAYMHAPCILLIEDLDRIAQRGAITMSNILNQLDGLNSRQGILVIATTNAPEKLDPALVHRPSRFDRVWRIPMPGEAQRLGMLRRLGAKFFSDEALASAAAGANGFSMAYTQEILSNALILAANEGQRPEDAHLARSLAQIKAQYKNTFAREGLARMEGQTQQLGFSIPAEAE